MILHKSFLLIAIKVDYFIVFNSLTIKKNANLSINEFILNFFREIYSLYQKKTFSLISKINLKILSSLLLLKLMNNYQIELYKQRV